jgi:GTP cyclohydrolase II
MLRMLNCTWIVPLTDNRAKLYGFTKTGIEITSRMPLEKPINADNAAIRRRRQCVPDTGSVV